ncbi:N-acetylmuramate alpha-1-phosphate uridylyltransferase MurU [Halomonas halocynthiae]|uniref:N-acetylmuramate alpha-1-phosphate uridylyltransferase MurU n=1 Tax=Halomonas halocynthiae TaxID=176290 RepID=UPI0004189110|nr:nucleotidyltransferase family protein [Halomonas halocynthiae]
MKAMILAAGLGTRMRPLTDHCPKPLLHVGGKPLIVHHLERLAAAGIDDVVINVSYRAEQIIAALGEGDAFGLRIHWSEEPTPLETGGGIRQALPLLGSSPFVLVNGDVWSDFDPAQLECCSKDCANNLAQLVMVNNPEHHPNGDFHLDIHGKLHADGTPRLTYSGIALINPSLVAHHSPGRFPLAPLLRDAMQQGKVSGLHHCGQWVDVGTPERLQMLDSLLHQTHT